MILDDYISKELASVMIGKLVKFPSEGRSRIGTIEAQTDKLLEVRDSEGVFWTGSYYAVEIISGDINGTGSQQSYCDCPLLSVASGVNDAP